MIKSFYFNLLVNYLFIKKIFLLINLFVLIIININISIIKKN